MNTFKRISLSTVANTPAKNNFFVPCVPISVSANLVEAQPLAKHLAISAPELAHLSLVEFEAIQIKKSELSLKVEECAMTNEALLDVYLMNVGDLFSNLAAYMLVTGKVAEDNENEKLQTNLQDSLKQVHAYSAAMDLVVAEYCVDAVVIPEKILDACLKRVQVLQKRWLDNNFQSIELALQLQRDAVYGAAASCLSEICQDGLDNQITFEQVSQVQEDVLVALATFVDLPFHGEWPVLRQRVIALVNKSTEAGTQ